MLYAVIDIGSTTIRMAIYEILDNKLNLIHKRKYTVGLASYVKDNVMEQAGIDKACEILNSFKSFLTSFNIENVSAFTTAALRNAQNSKEAVAEIIARTGIDLHIISGDEEATYDFIAATHELDYHDGFIIDIGGASTELIRFADNKIIQKTSLPIGSLALHTKYATDFLPSEEEIAQMIKEVHAIMGPNGIGKSTICKTIMGDPNYIVTSGSIFYNDTDLLKLNVSERARLGIYLLNQSPIEIPGVSNAEMLRLRLNENNPNPISIFDFNKKMTSICEKLDIPKSFIHRGINEGMSGGERKKNELLHLWMLEPSLIILDELDSGLDIDSLKTVTNSLNEYLETHPKASILLVTHHEPLLTMLNASHIHIMKDGHIIKSGDLFLAKEIENQGYKNI